MSRYESDADEIGFAIDERCGNVRPTEYAVRVRLIVDAVVPIMARDELEATERAYGLKCVPDDCELIDVEECQVLY